MAETMNFPNDWAEFLEDYSFCDHKEFYTNRARLIPTFRVKQMMEHYLRKAVTDNNVGSKWIPVTERLPREEWERFCAENDWDVYPCLVTIKNSRGGRYVTKLFFTGENFVDDEYIRYTAQVTHWMPLPEPPKGE